MCARKISELSSSVMQLVLVVSYFGVLTLLIECHEEHLACIKLSCEVLAWLVIYMWSS